MITENLIGKYFKADHPITPLNPSEYNEIKYVNVKWCPNKNRIVVYVRGEDTIWFSDSVIEHIVSEIDE